MRFFFAAGNRVFGRVCDVVQQLILKGNQNIVSLVNGEQEAARCWTAVGVSD